MAFESIKTTTVQKADTSSMDAELSRVGMKLELAKENLATYKDLTDEIEVAKSLLKSIETARDNGDKIIRENANKIEEQKIELEKVLKEKKDNENLRNTLEIESVELGGKINELNKEKQKAEKEFQAIKDEITPLEKKAEMLKFSEKTEKERIIKELETLNSSITDLKEEKKELENALTQREKDIKSNTEILLLQNDELKKVSEAKSILDEEIIKKHAEILAETAKYIKEKETRKAEITKLEGDLSLKMAWLSEKTELVKNAKNELEKKFNTKIDIIL